MRETLRQSMLLLHSWCGLAAGWILFFVFVTGTAGFAANDISRWMRPELPLMSAAPPPSDAVVIAERYLSRYAGGSDFWSIFLPGHGKNVELAVTWQGAHGALKRVVLDPATGEEAQTRARDTGGGYTLNAMHYALNYISRDAATIIVGAAAMIMLVSVMTGVVGHRARAQDLATLRAGQGYARRRSLHIILGTTALPFLALMTWSGLLFSLFVYMPAPQAMLFPDDEAMMRFNVEAYFPPDRPYGERMLVVPPSMTALPDVLKKAEDLWGAGAVSQLRIDNPGRDNTRVTAYTQRASVRGEIRAAFDAETGEAILLPPPRTATAKALATMSGLHRAHFAGPYLKGLYLVCGLAGTVLVATGLVQWPLKRRMRAAQTARERLGLMLVEKINLATVIGFPIGVGAYFWANRILPVDMPSRADWEVHTIFMVWASMLVYAAVRRGERAWVEMCVLASAVYALIPVLNVLTSTHHLGATIAAGDWALAALDLAALMLGVFFALMARALWAKRPS